MRFTLIALVIVAGCSLKNKELSNQTQSGHEELYSQPTQAVSEIPEGRKRVIIVATNDINGALGSQTVKIRDNHNKEPLQIDIGGIDYFSSYLKVLKSKYQSLILVDSGNILPKRIEDFPAIQNFYSTFGYSAVTVGLSDLSMPSVKGVSAIRSFAEASSTPVLLSNLYELKTARGVDWKGTSHYTMKEINGVKVGIIGLLADDISSMIPINSRVGLYIENAIQSTLHQARRLRSLGAQIVVVLTHQGLTCGQSIADATKLPLSKVNFEPKKEGVCQLNDSLGQYLQRLPAHLVDVVVAGRNLKKVANSINGISVISGFGETNSFSYVELNIDSKTNKIVPEETVIHQPVMICREFFKESNDCYVDDPTIDHKARVPAKFLGELIERDEATREKFKNFFEAPTTGSVDLTDDLLKNHDVNIIFKSSNKGTKSHLIVLNLSGRELSKWMDRSFNHNLTDEWTPSPFILKNGILALEIDGEKLNPERTYKVLTDLESLQRKPSLRKWISSEKASYLTDISWNDNHGIDEVKTAAAALEK